MRCGCVTALLVTRRALVGDTSLLPLSNIETRDAGIRALSCNVVVVQSHLGGFRIMNQGGLTSEDRLEVSLSMEV